MTSLDLLLGTTLIGSWESSCLFTLELVWAIHYYKHCSNEDTSYLKIISVAITIDFVGLIGKYANVYLYGVTHWGDMEYLKLQYWPVPVVLICSAIVAVLIQGYLTSRYIRLARNWFVGSVLILLILLGFGSSLAVVIVIVTWNAFQQRLFFEVPLKIWLITDAVVNTCIAFALISVLYAHHPASKHMDTVISRLMVTIFESGSIPAFCAMAILVGYSIAPLSNLPGVFFFSLSHLYILTMLYTLNIRQGLKNVSSGDETHPMTDIRFDNSRSSTSVYQVTSTSANNLSNMTGEGTQDNERNKRRDALHGEPSSAADHV